MNDQIQIALETLRAIEAAVVADSADVELAETLQRRIDNAVRIFCANADGGAT